jgi:hypothetical protein
LLAPNAPEASGKRTESNEKIVVNGVEMGKFFARSDYSDIAVSSQKSIWAVEGQISENNSVG